MTQNNAMENSGDFFAQAAMPQWDIPLTGERTPIAMQEQQIPVAVIEQSPNLSEDFSLFLGFDTETTDLGANKASVISLSFQLWAFSSTLAHAKKINEISLRITYPPEMETPMSSGALAVHGISREEARNTGIDATTPALLGILRAMLQKADATFAYNTDFDMRHISAVWPDFGTELAAKTNFDTMKIAGEVFEFYTETLNKKTNQITLKRKTRPSLREVYHHCFGMLPDSIQHNASADVEMTAKVLLACMQKQAEISALQDAENDRLQNAAAQQ